MNKGAQQVSQEVYSLQVHSTDSSS